MVRLVGNPRVHRMGATPQPHYVSLPREDCEKLYPD
jgi:hypothetical protein